ncbi:MAG: class I adenylate-forming enzyme family protein [Chloroflexota bacterium]
MVTDPFLHAWVLAHAATTADAPAIATPTTRLSYGDLAQRMLALAGRLRAHGVGHGDRVVVALPNGAPAVVASLAVQALGGTVVAVARGQAAGALRQVVTRAGARHVVLAGRDARLWGDALAGLAVDQAWVAHRDAPTAALLAALGRPAQWLPEDGAPDPAATEPPIDQPAAVDPDSVALILFTSGSTGTPLGVLQTHRNTDANSRSIVRYLGLTARDRVLATLPLSYCYGRSLLQTHLLVGGSVVFDDRFAFPRTVMESLAAEGCTGFAGVPLTFEILRRSVDLRSIPMPSLRYVTQAGGAMASDTTRWAREAFAPASLYVMYGQTEATARLTYLPPDRAVDKEGSIGIPIPGVEVRVVDQVGDEVPVGTVGELVARGDNVTPGYLDDPEATAGILRDGWLWTGDLARRDADGFLFHQGRAREIIKVGGRRVSPVEVEQALERHPAVVEAGVRGVADDLMGEVPAAFVVRRPGSDVTEDELRTSLRAAVPPWLVPASITFLDRLPRNETGKLLRADLPVAVAPVGVGVG